MFFLLNSESKISPVDLGDFSIGMDQVDLIRERLGLPNLPIERINSYVKRQREKPSLEVFEKEINLYPKLRSEFAQTNQVYVEFKDKQLNDCYTLEVDTVVSDTGEVLKASLYYKLNRAALFCMFITQLGEEYKGF